MRAMSARPALGSDRSSHSDVNDEQREGAGDGSFASWPRTNWRLVRLARAPKRRPGAF